MKTKIYTQHTDHINWVNMLAFYKDEIIIMQKWLEEISNKNTALEIRKDVEHYQNQLFIQANNIHTIEHHITKDESQLQKIISENPVASDHRVMEDHLSEREMVEDFMGNFNKLRKEFKSFVGKYL